MSRQPASDPLDNLDDLANAFAEVGRHLTSRDPGPLLRLAVDHVTGCDWASVTTIVDGSGTTLAATGPRAGAADAVQHRLGAGPCMQAAGHRAYHTVFPVAADDRWPEVGRALEAETSVRSVLAVHMLEDDPTSLNLYGARANGFGDDSLADAAVIAGQAATLLAAADPHRAMSTLQNALSAHREIEIAIDILTSDGKHGREDAILALYGASRRLHRTLLSVAHEVVESGSLPKS